MVTAKQESKNGNDVVVSLTADDGAAGSGVTRVLYSTGPSSNPKSNENTMWGTYTDEDKVKVQLSADHDTYVHFYAQDAAGNESDYANINLGKGEAVTPTPTPSVDSVAVSGDGVKDGKLALVAGGAAQLSAEVKVTGDAAKTVSWKSSDEKVATVDKDGKVTAVAEGTATITATSMVDENKSASVEVTVTKPEAPVPPATDEERKPLADKIAAVESEKLNQNDYTADSWKAYADALAAAKQVVEDPAATAPQVTAALNKLTAAHDGLAKKDSGEKPEPQKPGQDQKPDQQQNATATTAPTGSAVAAVAVAVVVLGAAGAGLVIWRKRRV